MYGKEAKHIIMELETKKQAMEAKKAKTVANTIQENLHPSWQAKKQKRPAIAAFQGKKVVFGDHESTKSPSVSEKLHSSWEAKKPTANLEKLHPSWEAKRQAKEKLTQLSGKATKIIFD